MNEIHDVVVDTIAGVLNLSPQQVTETPRLRELPGIDSIQVLRIVTKLEKTLRIELDEQVVFSINTLQELVTEAAQCSQATAKNDVASAGTVGA